MIIFGTRSTVLKQAPYPGHHCNRCGSEASYIRVIQNYFHIFWIPVFPYNKRLRIVCKDCSHLEKPKNVSPQFQDIARQLKASVKTPLWMFSGLGVVALGILAILILGKQLDKLDQEFINNPEVGDVYLYERHTFSNDLIYSYLKVSAIAEDSIFLYSGVLNYDRYPLKFDPEDAFYIRPIGVHKSEVLRMYQNDEILNVRRNWGPYTGFDREVELDSGEVLKVPVQE